MLKIDTYEKMLNTLLSAKHLICMGAGKFSIHLQELDEIILSKIEFFIDNDHEKQGTKVYYKNHCYDVLNPNYLFSLEKDHVILLVGIVNYEAAIESLDESLRSIDYISLGQLITMHNDYRALQKKLPVQIKASNGCIPKRIHYCWVGGTDIPDKYKYYIESWKKYCPDYDIVEWNEKNYDFTKNLYMKQAYEKKKWGFVPDYARLDIIYREGGIYLDTDVELISNLDDLLCNNAFAGFETETSVNLGQGFGAVAGNPVIKEMRDCYDNLLFIRDDGKINNTASPIYQTRVLEKHGLIKNGEYQKLDHITIYPEKMFCPKSIRTFRIDKTEYTKSIHHFAASWLTEEQKEFWIKSHEPYQFIEK